VPCRAWTRQSVSRAWTSRCEVAIPRPPRNINRPRRISLTVQTSR
jgi:hypothetical protein